VSKWFVGMLFPCWRSSLFTVLCFTVELCALSIGSLSWAEFIKTRLTCLCSKGLGTEVLCVDGCNHSCRAIGFARKGLIRRFSVLTVVITHVVPLGSLIFFYNYWACGAQSRRSTIPRSGNRLVMGCFGF
jgi:hypothetical protein